MAQMIQMNTPSGPEYLQGFMDRWSQNRQNRIANADRSRQLDINQGQMDVNQGQLKMQQDAATQSKLMEESKGVLAQVVAFTKNNELDKAKALIDQTKTQRPEMVPYMGEMMARLTQTPQDRTEYNANTYAADTTGKAAAGSANPNAVNLATKVATKDWMPKEGFAQQQATDLQARGGGSKEGIPAATGNAVMDFERRATEAMPTAAQNQAAKTQITTTGMREAGETKREKMKLDANAAGISSLLGGGMAGGVANPDAIKTASPTVRALVNRSFDTMLMRRWKPEQVNAIMAAVQQIDPEFNMADYNAQYKTKQAFTSGAQGLNITAVNTAIRHLKTLDEDLKSLDNSDFPAWNAVSNWTARQAGVRKTQKAMASVQKDADAVAN